MLSLLTVNKCSTKSVVVVVVVVCSLLLFALVGFVVSAFGRQKYCRKLSRGGACRKTTWYWFYATSYFLVSRFLSVPALRIFYVQNDPMKKPFGFYVIARRIAW